MNSHVCRRSKLKDLIDGLTELYESESDIITVSHDLNRRKCSSCGDIEQLLTEEIRIVTDNRGERYARNRA